MVFGITADVLDCNGDFEKVSDVADLLSRQLGGFKCIWHGKEIVGVASVYAAPAEVVGEPRSIRTLHQLLQPPEVFAVGLLSRAEIHRDAVLHDFVLVEDPIQDVQRPPAIDHEILRDNLKPVDNGLARKNMVVVRSTQANPYSVICKPIKAISRHNFFAPFSKDRGPGDFAQPSYRIVAGFGLLRGWLGTIGRATALALARVLAFATVVAGLAAALALAGVLALTGVLFLHLPVVFLVLVLILSVEGSLQRGEQSRGLDCRSGPGEHPRKRRASQQSLGRL